MKHLYVIPTPRKRPSPLAKVRYGWKTVAMDARIWWEHIRGNGSQYWAAGLGKHPTCYSEGNEPWEYVSRWQTELHGGHARLAWVRGGLLSKPKDGWHLVSIPTIKAIRALKEAAL